MEVNIIFGVKIPQKAEEIQTKISEEITKLTGLHVASVHVVFKNVISVEQANRIAAGNLTPVISQHSEEEYTDEF